MKELTKKQREYLKDILVNLNKLVDSLKKDKKQVVYKPKKK